MFGVIWSRRAFLKASLACTLTLAARKPAFPFTANGESLPEGKLSLYNTHSRERMTITFRDQSGDYNLEALMSLNWILRCHYTEEVADMDNRVIEYLSLVDRGLGGGNEFHIISGYRSPAYNDLLLRKGRHVARNSLHLKGKAIDISVPGVELDKVRQVAVSLQYGGVGYYPGTGFVHLDSGSFRTW